MQIKTIIRYHLTSVRMAIKNSTNTGKGPEKREPSYTVGENVSWYNHHVGKRKAAQEGSDICILMAESHCTAETNTL